MFTLVANVGPHVRDLRLAHREGPESRLPEELRELRVLLTEPVVRALLKMTDDVAQRLGPGEQKEDVRVVLSSRALAAFQAARFVFRSTPRASAFGLSPGLHSPGPLGRVEQTTLQQS